MIVVSAYIREFRNLSGLDLEFHPETNLILGENAQGKTSLLESIAYLSTGGSHRATHDRELIGHGSDFSVVRCGMESVDRSFELEAQLHRGKRRKLLKNQVFARNIQEFSDVFQTVLFCPEDLVLVRGASLLRRRFLDRAISQLRPQYGLAMAEYKRLYQHKLKILKDPNRNMLQALPEFNFRMAQTGTMMIHYRAHFVKRLQEVVPPIHGEFAGGREEIQLAYQTVSTVTDALAGERAIFAQVLAHQESHYEAELASGKILTGPHKDDLLLFLDGQEAKLFASQGQTRTLALSLKLGERDVFFQETEEYPVLLLDDVLSELDRSRQEFVLNRIKTGQVFITSCEDEGFLPLRQGKKFIVSQGEVVSEGNHLCSDSPVESLSEDEGLDTEDWVDDDLDI